MSLQEQLWNHADSMKTSCKNFSETLIHRFQFEAKFILVWDMKENVNMPCQLSLSSPYFQVKFSNR